MAYVNSVERYERQLAYKEGYKEGYKKGCREAAIKVLKILIQVKFGIFPDWAQQKIEEATQEQLTDWVLATLTADSLESMLSYE